MTDENDDRPEGREYKAVYGRKKPLLKFIPNDRKLRRYLPFTDIRQMDVSEAGDELAIEFSAVMVVLQGEGMESVADAVQGMMGANVEAFDLRRHDNPPPPKPGDDPAPVIRHIAFLTQQPKAPDGHPPRARPVHEPETVSREKEMPFNA